MPQDKKNLAPIVLFCYNRPLVLQKTIAALQKNTLSPESDLFIYSDGPKPGAEKAVAKVRAFLKTIEGFKSIHIQESPINKGSMHSVKDGITEVVNTYGKVIVFEDDILSSPYTLLYCNNALKKYQNTENVFCINAMAYLKAEQLSTSYKEDSYFTYRNASHGWATWKDRWNKVLWDEKTLAKEIQDPNTRLSFNKGGNDLSPMLESKLNDEIDAWDIQFSYSISKHNGICLAPRYSYTSHLDDEPGTHISTSPPASVHNVSKALEHISYPKTVEVNQDIALEFTKAYGNIPEYFYPQIKNISDDEMHRHLVSQQGITPLHASNVVPDLPSTRNPSTHKVAHLQSTNVGGAFIATQRLHQSLWNEKQKNTSNISSYLFLKKAYSHIAMNLPYTYNVAGKYPDDLYIEFGNMRGNQYKGNTMFGGNYPSLNFDEVAFLRSFDVINLHWTNAMLSVESIAFLSHTDLPLVLTAHDKNILSGGCHCFHGCEKWQKDCKDCPQLKNTYDDFPAKILKFKKKYWNTENMTIVALNPNLVETYKKSPVLKNARIETIYNSIDTEFFTPVSEEEKKSIRAKLELPQDKTILMYSADYISTIKGYKECIETLRILQNKDAFHLIVLGNVANITDIPISHSYFGHVAPHEMKRFYNAADIVIVPSLEETLPNVMLESLACGTPLVAFTGVGGCEHFVKNDITGYTVPMGNTTRLAQVIEKIAKLPPEKYYAMSKACRDCAVKYFTPQMQAQKYNKLYKSVIAERKKTYVKPYSINTSIPQFNPETAHYAIEAYTKMVAKISKDKWYAFGQLTRKEKIMKMGKFIVRKILQKLRLYSVAQALAQGMTKNKND